MLTEIELLRAYSYGPTRSENMNILSLIREVLTDDLHDKIMQTMDITSLKKEVDLIFEYLSVRKRYNKLNSLFGNILTYNEIGFSIDGQNFSTLDEVEKAWNNKAFL
jgi:hypothetical protein